PSDFSPLSLHDALPISLAAGGIAVYVTAKGLLYVFIIHARIFQGGKARLTGHFVVIGAFTRLGELCHAHTNNVYSACHVISPIRWLGCALGSRCHQYVIRRADTGAARCFCPRSTRPAWHPLR